MLGKIGVPCGLMGALTSETMRAGGPTVGGASDVWRLMALRATAAADRGEKRSLLLLEGGAVVVPVGCGSFAGVFSIMEGGMGLQNGFQEGGCVRQPQRNVNTKVKQ